MEQGEWGKEEWGNGGRMNEGKAGRQELQHQEQQEQMDRQIGQRWDPLTEGGIRTDGSAVGMKEVLNDSHLND